MKIAILITGSRHERNPERIACGLSDALKTFHGRLRLDGCNPIIIRLIHGDAPGVDRLADKIAHQKGWEIHPRPAAWDTLGRKAGPVRNAEMVAEVLTWVADGWTPVCIAFPTKDSIGTWDCIRRASEAGIPVYIQPEVKP